jgi:hypothetical protein
MLKCRGQQRQQQQQQQLMRLVVQKAQSNVGHCHLLKVHHLVVDRCCKQQALNV